MRLTVIMPLYNRELYVRLALESLLRQQSPGELDLLVINDGSTDGGPELVEQLGCRHPQIRMVTTENQGVTKARNFALTQLRDDADFVTFLDSDDISPINRLQSDLEMFEQDPSIQFTYGKMTLVDHLDDATFEPAVDSNQATVRGISLSAGIYRRPFLQSVGTFDESFEQAEDADFLFRAFESGVHWRLTETVCVYYRQHAGNMTLQRDQLRMSLMRAIHRSVVRRRQNPALALPSNLFDLQALSNLQGM